MKKLSETQNAHIQMFTKHNLVDKKTFHKEMRSYEVCKLKRKQKYLKTECI